MESELSGFAMKRINGTHTVYFADVCGKHVEILMVNYKGTDYSMEVDGVSIFQGWRERWAKPKIMEVLDEIRNG